MCIRDRSSESGRVSAENARSTEETARNNAENARATAEASRATEETKRKNNEEARQDAEVIREQNEEARVSTQSQRDATWTTWQELIEDGILPPATESVKGVMYLDATDEDKKHESAVSFGAYEAVVEHQNNKLNNKVDKIEGMSLSQNSYTCLLYTSRCV